LGVKTKVKTKILDSINKFQNVFFIIGTCGLIVGHPLDTVKALIQTRNQHKNILSSATILIKQTNGTGFFRGLTIPFFTYGGFNAALFGIYGSVLKTLENALETKEASLLNVFIAGTISGTLLTVPANPMEVIRIKLQTYPKNEFKSVQDCVRKIIKTDGYLGFFKGVNTSLLRDSSSYGIYFLSFEYLRRMGRDNELDNQIFVDLVCGGCAGSLSWAMIMPLDVIKSRIQMKKKMNLSMADEMRLILKEHGIAGLYKGLTAVVIRGFLVSAVTFCCYARTLDYLNKRDEKNN